MTTKPMWIVKRADGCLLATNNRWYRMVSGVSEIKKYKTNGGATRSLKRYGAPLVGDEHFESRGSVHALYAGDEINVCGQITRINSRIEGEGKGNE